MSARDVVRHWVYILTCSDDSLYAGYATDVERRVAQHNAGKGSRYVRSRRPARLSYLKEAPSRGEALRLESRIKKMTRVEKARLCSSFKKGESYSPR